LRPGVSLLTVHALGGAEMLSAAVEAAAERAAELGIATPRVLAITVLTSHAPGDLATLGLAAEPWKSRRASQASPGTRAAPASCVR